MLRHYADQNLAKRALQGNKQAKEDFVCAHYDAIYRFLHLISGSGQVAEELLQETFLRAWQGLKNYKGQASLKTWLHRIAYREYLRWRHRRPWPEVLDEKYDPTQDFLGTLLDGIWIEQAMRCLSPDLRETLALFYVQNLSVNQIAQVLDIKEGTVLSRLHTARLRLKQQLNSQDVLAPIYQGQPPQGTKRYEMSKTTY